MSTTPLKAPTKAERKAWDFNVLGEPGCFDVFFNWEPHGRNIHDRRVCEGVPTKTENEAIAHVFNDVDGWLNRSKFVEEL